MELLAFVLREGRYLTSESPEQVGAATGVSGRAIRRIERADLRKRPRTLTLEALGGYYSLNPAVLLLLASCTEHGEDLDRFVRSHAEASGIDPRERLEQVALALARVRPPERETTESDEHRELLAGLETLSPARRRLLLSLARELGMAQAEERRRREAP